MVKCPSISMAEKSKPMRAFLLPKIELSTCKGFFGFSPAIKCFLMLGTVKNEVNQINTEKPPNERKGICQLNLSAKNNPMGTPATEATEKDAITRPIAPALLSNGTASLTIDITNAPNTPPKAPASDRVIINISYVVEKPQANVPNAKPVYITIKLVFLSKRSIKKAEIKPVMPAVIV